MSQSAQAERMSSKQAQQTAKAMALCLRPPAERTKEDIWFIRDRLHECSSFFRLWPSQLQQLICRLAKSQHWVQNEVLASQGGKPSQLCFILEGEAAVALRSAPGHSTLKDVAVLQAGGTFGELALLGLQRNPAFIVVRSKQLLALAVDAQHLAEAMQKQQHQLANPQPQQQPWQSDKGSISIEAMYKLIGGTGSEVPGSSLSAEQLGQMSRLKAQQLQAAAAAEAATVGAWLLPPHQVSGRSNSSTSPDQAAAASVAASATAMGTLQLQPTDEATPDGRASLFAVPAAPADVQLLEVNARCSSSVCSSSEAGDEELMLRALTAIPLAGVGHDCSSGVVEPPAGKQHALAADRAHKSTLMYRSRHHAILHVAVQRAANTVD